MTIQVGKRYVCKKCGSEFVVTRAGTGALQCCGQPMEIKVKEYGTQGAFQRDARRMAEDGWIVQSVTDRPQRVGCLRMLSTGFLALLWKILSPTPR